MQQEFFKNTILSKYIKYLLANTPIPQYTFISENEDMIEGCLYTYKHHILKCTKSGRFTGINGTLNNIDHLRVQEPLTVNDPFNVNGSGEDNRHMNDYQKYAPSDANITEGWMSVLRPDLEHPGDYISPANVIPLAVTDEVVGVKIYKAAEFKIVDEFLPGAYKTGVTELFNSNVSYYDEETHKRLGEYLRYLKNMFDLDLMCLYNCFNYNVVRDIILDRNVAGNVYEGNNIKNKVILVPIKFNHTYTIAIESTSPVDVCSVFYNNKLVMDARRQDYLTRYLSETMHTYNNTQFSIPVTYRIENKSSDLHKYERYLYMAIQVSTTNNSSIVVLEGDYSHNGVRVIADIKGLRDNEGTVDKLSSMMISNLSLLAKNDNIQHPFSDKLIQYLVRNTIDTREYIDDNVKNIIKQIGDFSHGYDGQWTNQLRYTLYSRYMDIINHDELNYTDILGYVDNDVENAVRKGYLNLYDKT